jgi:hypothetical protein
MLADLSAIATIAVAGGEPAWHRRLRAKRQQARALLQVAEAASAGVAKNAVAGVDPEALLERADNDGEGPESAWARDPGAGELHVTAFDADNQSDPESTALAGTHAVLQTWWGDAEPSYFTVASGETAVLWRPLELDVSEGVPYAVEQYATEGASDDPDIF